MLERGDLDALFHVAPADSPLVQRLIGIQGVRLLSFGRAQAYVRRFPFLSSVTLPRGVFDLAGNVPDHDIVLLSPTANLLARDSLHPALAYLLMTAATTVHGEGSLLQPARPVPRLARRRLPVQRGGAALLQGRARHGCSATCPTGWQSWWTGCGSWCCRSWPLVVPLSRLLPQLYAWRMRSRLYRWYARLKEIELELEDKPTAEELEQMLERLDEIEAAVSHLAHAARLLREPVHLPQQHRAGAGAGAEASCGARG